MPSVASRVEPVSSGAVETVVESRGSNPPLDRASIETEYYKQVQNLLQNKIRNLEKRKLKLDGYEKELESGKKLQPEQMVALKNAEEVSNQLDSWRDLLKQVKGLELDHNRQLKSSKRMELKERTHQERVILQEYMKISEVMRALGDESVRKEFSKGENEALKLTEEQLKLIDSLYHLINPSREDIVEKHTTWNEMMESASQHVHLLITASTKTLPESKQTYKDIKTLIDEILRCGYFDKGSRAHSPAGQQQQSSDSSVSGDAPIPVVDNDAAGTDPSIVVEGSAKQPIPVAQHPQTQSNINENSTLPDVIMMNGMVVDQGAVSGITFMQPVEPNVDPAIHMYLMEPPQQVKGRVLPNAAVNGDQSSDQQQNMIFYAQQQEQNYSNAENIPSLAMAEHQKGKPQREFHAEKHKHSYDDRSWAQPHQQASNYDSAQFGGQYEGNPNEEDAQENGNDMEIGQWNPNGGPGDHAAQRFGGGRGGRPRGSRGRGRGDFYRGGGGGGGGNGGGGGRGFRGGAGGYRGRGGGEGYYNAGPNNRPYRGGGRA